MRADVKDSFRAESPSDASNTCTTSSDSLPDSEELLSPGVQSVDSDAARAFLSARRGAADVAGAAANARSSARSVRRGAAAATLPSPPGGGGGGGNGEGAGRATASPAVGKPALPGVPAIGLPANLELAGLLGGLALAIAVISAEVTSLSATLAASGAWNCGGGLGGPPRVGLPLGGAEPAFAARIGAGALLLLLVLLLLRNAA
jgi:hypothetical protein